MASATQGIITAFIMSLCGFAPALASQVLSVPHSILATFLSPLPLDEFTRVGTFTAHLCQPGCHLDVRACAEEF